MSNLDDFFKKRDKKKKVTGTNSKTKFSTLDTEKLAKNLELITVNAPLESEGGNDTDLLNENNKESEDSQVAAAAVAPVGRSVSDNVDEEWKPFDYEENKDYTGLRINTNTWKDEEEDNDSDNVTDENAIKSACPWGASGKPKEVDNDEDADEEDQVETTSVPKTLAAVLAENTNTANLATPDTVTASAAGAGPNAYIPPSMRARMAAEASGAKPVEVKAAPAPAASSGGGGAYIPPSMRGNGSSMSSGGGGMSGSGSYEISTSSVNYRRPNKLQPNLNDCLEFPSLDATGEMQTVDSMVNGNGGERFELVKKSARSEVKSDKDSHVHIQNKFGALSGNQ